MGMSTGIRGFKPPDEKWQKMKAAWDACEAAGTDQPKAVGEFFRWDRPDDAGVAVPERELEACGALRRYTADAVDGYEVDVTKLPPDVKIIRFTNSW